MDEPVDAIGVADEVRPLTVGDLRKALEGLPDDMPVFTAIGHDGGWPTDAEVTDDRVASGDGRGNILLITD